MPDLFPPDPISLSPAGAALRGDEDGKESLPLSFGIGVALAALLCAPVAVVIGFTAGHTNPTTVQLAAIPPEHGEVYLRAFQESSRRTKRRFALWFGVTVWALSALALWLLGSPFSA